VGLKDDLTSDVADIFRSQWTRRDGVVVPEPEDLKLGNDGVDLEAAVLYADMSDSTKLVDERTPTFAAEVYKAYLHCAARIIKSEGGVITAYDGDRVMGVFIGGSRRTDAARTALKINYAVIKIVNPGIKHIYSDTDFVLKHQVGVDSSKLLVARIGVRNDNDLVWVGRAANYAAKLAALDDTDPVFITAAVFDNMLEEAKYGGDPRQLMWRERQWSQMGDQRVYSSTWTWSV
jgi:class 3 adenylate cyclase